VSQTDALKTAIRQLAEQHQPTPAELTAQLGLIGAFRSGVGDLGENHPQRIKQRLRAKQSHDRSPATGSNEVKAAA